MGNFFSNLFNGTIAGKIAGGSGGGLFGNAGESRGTIRRNANALLSTYIDPTTRENFARAEGQMTAVPDTIRSAYTLARKNVGESARIGQVAAVEQGQKAQGQALQNLTNSGFSGAGSIAANMRLGVGYGTARAIQDVQDRVGQIGASLATNEGQDLATAQTRLGQFYQQKEAALQKNNMLRWDLATGMQPQPGTNNGIDLAGIASIAALFL